MIEDLEALAAHGEMLELFSKEEIENMINISKFSNQSRISEKVKSKEHIIEDIRQKCREDFKMLL